MPDGGRIAASRRRAPWSAVTLPPVQLPDGRLVLRSPTLADGPAWSAARVANREWLERAFPAWGADWVAEQSEVAWAQRWWHLRGQAVAGRAKPFVMFLDGVLIGEIGIDAMDQVTGAGEASVWMVRDHGSSTVMNAASLLLVQHAFDEPHPVSRIVSPVATTSRRGRAPGLTAVGFEIEATVPRRVGSKGLVDHDMWVLHNSAASRNAVAGALSALTAPSGAEPPPPDTALPSGVTTPRGALAATAGRAALREARAGLRGLGALVTRRRTGTRAVRLLTVPESGRPVSLRPARRRDLAAIGAFAATPPDATRWAVETDGRVAAVISHRTDAGTATSEVFATARPGTDHDVLATALGAVLDKVRPGVDEPRVLVVRVPTGAPEGTTPDADLLTGLGLRRIATYRGASDERGAWGGEEVWRA